MSTGKRGSSISTARSRWPRDRRFFLCMAAASVVATFVGFAPTYYLKTVYGAPVLPALVHIHGILFTSWILLLTAQTSLVALRRTDLHRRIGIGGAILAGLMTVVAFPTSVGAVQRGTLPIELLVVAMGTVVVFPVLVGTALFYRRQAETHKRLMLIATAELLGAGFFRWPVIRDQDQPLGAFVATDLAIVAPLLIYDIVVHRRVYPATIMGGLFLIASQALRMAIGGTETWLGFARWLTS